jgi:hypothetical protein
MCLLEEDLVADVDSALQRAPAELQLALTEFDITIQTRI